jgi:lipoteichoic acid synthase
MKEGHHESMNKSTDNDIIPVKKTDIGDKSKVAAASDAADTSQTEKGVVSEQGKNPSDHTQKVLSKGREMFHKSSKKLATSLNGFWNSYVSISSNNFIYPVVFLIGMLIYLEVMLHFLIYRSVDNKIIYPILFAVPFGILLTFIIGLFSEKINKTILWCITGLICLVFNLQLVYYNIFKVYFSFQSLGMADDAVSEFGTDIITGIKGNIGGILLLFMPFIILALIVNNLLDYHRRRAKEQGILLATSLLFHLVVLVTLLLFGKGDFSPYDLYYNSKVPDLCGKQLGLLTMTRLDIVKLSSGKEELELDLADTTMINKSPTLKPTVIPTKAPAPTITTDPKQSDPDATPKPTQPPTPTPIDRSPNVMNIDFAALAEREGNETIRTLHNYFASVTPTNKNEYTGMFQGYNLIMITAEGFSPYAVNPVKTPTLYRLVNEGFVFKNFYTALWQTSTSDGEFVAMNGIIPVGTRSMFLGRNNLWPFSLGHQFNKLGVASKAYHNHTYTYYQRNETHPNLGYIFKAKDHGMTLEHPNSWPASDLEMINATVDEYVNENQFHVYYLTVSGHMNYTFEGNSISFKNRELVQDLPYSSDAKAYIACQMELDMALEQLIKRLEEAGVADRTVIALSADHYPYGWEKYKLDELAGHEIDPNFEIYRNNFILWNEGMKENIVINKPCSSLDIIPTLSNLFGLEYDSRLLMGQDILSDTPPLVILSNRSFITDKVMYNSETRELIKLTEEELPEDYISNYNKIIKNKFSVSQSILKNDYYRYVFPNYSDRPN